MSTQKTALYDYHKSLGANFVPFAGYEMPVQYSSGIVEEHKLQEVTQVCLMFLIWDNYPIEGNEDLATELEKIIPTDLKNINLINQIFFNYNERVEFTMI